MSKITTWPIPLTERRFPLYTVTVDDVDVPVWTGRVRETINKPKGAGYTNMLNGPCDWCGFARFDFDATVDVTVQVTRDFQTAAIVPRRLGIEPTIDGRAIRFRLDRRLPDATSVTLLLDGADEEPLHLFTHRPETDVPDSADPSVIHFGPGEHWVDHLQLKSGQTLYLDGAAIVRGVLPAGAKGTQGGVLNLFSYSPPMVQVREARNVRICGRGILDGTLLPHPARAPLHVTQSQQVRIEGIMLRNSSNWHLPIRNSRDIQVVGINGLSGRLNSDGINCVSSSDVRVTDCFMRTHDDTFVVKTMDPQQPSQNIVYERCVAWNDWGYAFGVSYETRADIANIRFKDCDAIYARHWPIGIHVVDSGTIHAVRFDNMTIDYPATRIAREMNQALVKINLGKDVWAKDEGIGHIRDITLHDIDVRGQAIPDLILRGHSADHLVRDVRIQGLRVNGETIDSTDHPKVKTNEHVVGLSFER